MATTHSPLISIIIPVYHEADRINGLLRSLCALDTQHVTERIVVEGAQECDTLSVILDPDTVRVRSSRGRARQMNAGAARARGDIILFLHADTVLPHGAFDTIREVMGNEKPAVGAFSIRFDSERTVFKFFGWLATMRSRITHTPYGDQAIFLTRKYFYDLGGYGDIPLMEDVELMRRIRRRGGRIRVVTSPVISSVRRWESEGLVYCTARNFILLCLYRLGVPPRLLKRCYPDEPLRVRKRGSAVGPVPSVGRTGRVGTPTATGRRGRADGE